MPEQVQKIPAGTPQFRQEELEVWNLNAAECSFCRTVVPHNQLSVCTLPGCSHGYREEMEYESVTLFFNKEKVFCGQCALYIGHFEHQKHLKQALSLAISTTSKKVAPMLTENYTKTAHMDQDSLLDFVMAKDLGTDGLMIPDFHFYLASSVTTFEWETKKRRIEGFIDLLQKNREEGLENVRSLAKSSVEAYQHLMSVTASSRKEEPPATVAPVKNSLEKHREQLTTEERREIYEEGAAFSRFMRDEDSPVRNDTSPVTPVQMETDSSTSTSSHGSNRALTAVEPESVEVKTVGEESPILQNETAQNEEPSSGSDDVSDEEIENEEEKSESEKEEELDAAKGEEEPESTASHVPQSPTVATESTRSIFTKLLMEFAEWTETTEEARLLRYTQRLHQMTENVEVRAELIKLFPQAHNLNFPKP